jgi:DNA repair photolyase
VCYDMGFPVFVLTRSPLALRDLDLLQAINERARAVVAFSVISAPGAPSYDRVCQIERLAPPAAKRFAAMEQIARAGILTGACFMPILPGLCDDDATLSSVIGCTAGSGGQFVLASGLTLADQQRSFFFSVLRQRYPDLIPLYERLFPAGSDSAAGWSWPAVGRRIRQLCHAHGIADRMPRPIIAGDKRTVNKRVVEALAGDIYTMELTGVSPQRQWAYRKAAWAIEDLEQDISLVYHTMGSKGLQSIENVGPTLVGRVEQLVSSLSAR